MQGSKLSAILFYRPLWLVWVYRILLSINILIPGLTYADHAYPLDVLCMAVLAFWADLAKLTWISVLLLLLAFYINHDHLFHYLHE